MSDRRYVVFDRAMNIRQVRKFTAAEAVAVLQEIEDRFPMFRGRFVAVEVEP